MWLADRITGWCSTKMELDSLHKARMNYGVELFFENVLKTIGMLLLGILFGRFGETMLFLGVFCTLRYFAGGIHMKTSRGCFFFTVFIWGFCLWGSEAILLDKHGILFLLILSIGLFFLYAPSDSKENPITDLTVRRHKKIRAVAAAAIFSLCVALVPSLLWKRLIVLAMVAEVLTILPVIKYRNERRSLSN